MLRPFTAFRCRSQAWARAQQIGHCYSTKVLATGYRPQDVERDNEQVWKIGPARHDLPAYSYILPPPNVTGHLHLGHALMCTIQDVTARHRRRSRHTSATNPVDGPHDVCWIPGTDHAGIATQVIVEKHLRQQRGLSRHQLGREPFLAEVWRWRDDKAHRIRADLRRLGASADWNREYFTMDATQSEAVRTAFVRLFDAGLVYRDGQLVNWSCALESTISDIEVQTIALTGPTALAVPGYDRPVQFGELTELAYTVASDDAATPPATTFAAAAAAALEVIVATTRPETVLGDVAVAVHPDDARYSHLRPTSADSPPTMLWHPLRPERIPLLFDAAVDPSFGTGAVKITPAHDRFDLELARRHPALPRGLAVIDERGSICAGFDGFSGLPRFAARQLVRDRLAQTGSLRAIRPHSMQLPVCSRSGDVVELLLRPQWFVRCGGAMAERARQAVATGALRLEPPQFEAEWHRWLGEEARDWCVSRQLWWGHRVPAYECTTPEVPARSVWVAAADEVEARTRAIAVLNGQPDSSRTPVVADQLAVRQDDDVLDTWFSSALLPFSTVGWPNTETVDFQRYYPHRLLVTGHDILFFWVARMVMLGQQLTGRLPFDTVLLHGIVCDAHGRKMSKSLGNVVTPGQVIDGATLAELHADTEAARLAGVLTAEEAKRSMGDQANMFPAGIPACGTDALRFTLCTHNIRSHFIAFDATECHTNKLFFNKIWQATRFTLAAQAKWSVGPDINDKADTVRPLTTMDRWILHRLATTVRIVHTAMDAFQFHVATAALKTFFYQNLCDVYVETTKPALNDVQPAAANAAQLLTALGHCEVLHRCLQTGLAELAPFAPFVCQELQQHLGNTLSQNQTPFVGIDDWLNEPLAGDVNEMLSICAAIRQLQSEHGITRKHQPTIHVHIVGDEELLQRLRLQHGVDIRTLCKSADVRFSDQPLLDAAALVAQSTAGAHCQFGIELAAGGAGETGGLPATRRTTTVNERKQQKLQQDLDRLERTVANDGYRRSASAKVQRLHGEKIERLKSELASIRQMA